MARPRVWSALSERTQQSYLKEGAKHGMSDSATRAYYDNPSNNLATLRRHVTKSGTPIPEHGLTEAQRNPAKYSRYLRKHERGGGGGPSPDELQQLREAAFANHYRKLNEHLKYNEATSRQNILGDPEKPDEYPGMTATEARWTSQATAEQLRERASANYVGNPWWYH